MTYFTDAEKAKNRAKPVKAGDIMVDSSAQTKITPKRAAELHAKRDELFQSLSLPRGCKTVADMVRNGRDAGYR